MFSSLNKLNALLSGRDRRNLLILLIMMVAAAVLEVVGVSAIPAYVSAVVSPERFMAYPGVQPVLHWLGLSGTQEILIWGSLGLFLLFGLKNAFLVWNYYWQARFIANRRVHLARRLVTAYLHAPYSFHLGRNTSELIRNVNRETNLLANHVLAPLLEIITRSLILVAVTALLLWMEPFITLIWMGIFGLISAFGVSALSLRMRRYGLMEQVQRKQVIQALHQGLGSIKESRVLHREDYFVARIVESISRIAAATRFKRFGGQLIAPVTEAVAVIGLSAITVTLVLMDRPMESILVTVALFVVALVRLRDALNVIMSRWTVLRYHVAAVDPVYADLQALESSPTPVTAPADGTLSITRDIQLHEVWYRYPGASEAALRGVSLRIPAGTAVGIVGGTGAGKSTLVDVILGLLVPERGELRVDGADLHRGGLHAWQSWIGYIPQSIYLLDDTLRRNIALGVEDADIDEVALTRAIHAAQLEPLVAKLPAGLDTPTGERGVRLSGGERQRIGIARALYHNPQVLIMDEATSALDNLTEQAIIQAVDALRGQRTVIMIAHRLSTVRNCHTLYFLKEGRIEATGNYEELRASSQDFSLMASN